MSDRPFRRVSLCPCGWWHEPSFGSEWVSSKDYPVCPSCGASHRSRDMVTGRAERQPKEKWWHFPKYKFVVRKEEGQ